MAAAVQQNLQLAVIPVFQFAIFYAIDLEINPGPVMKVTGTNTAVITMVMAMIAPRSAVRTRRSIRA